MPELAGREKKLMMIIYYYYYCSIVWSQQDFHTGPFLIMYASFVHIRNNSGNSEWALFLEVECFVVFFVNLRRSSLRLTCGFCAQNMKIQFILNCIWPKCEYLVHVCVFKTDMKKRDFFIYFLVTWCAFLRTRIKSYLCYSEVRKVSIE